MRSRTSSTSPALTMSPVSSRASRSAAPRSVSPSSTTPPGSDHSPSSGGLPRFTSKTRPWSTITAPTPTMGRSGYSRLLSGRAFSEVADPGLKLRDLDSRADDLRFMALCSWQREERPWLQLDELPRSAGISHSKVQPVVSARDGPAAGRLSLHLGLDRKSGPVALNRSLTQVEVDSDRYGLRKERCNLLPEEGAILHPWQIKEGKKLFLALPLQSFAELSQQARRGLRIERARRRRLFRRRCLRRRQCRR